MFLFVIVVTLFGIELLCNKLSKKEEEERKGERGGGGGERDREKMER